MPKFIRTLTVFYNTVISNKEVPLFRGAVLKSLGNNANVLYHNHASEDTFRYSYPLIQYKRIGGKAAITCVEEGADIIGQFMSEAPATLRLGTKETECEVAHIHPARILVQTWEKPFTYHLNRWLPLNSKNYQLYMASSDDN